jgi:para-aminobenzoate synthetase component 1
MIVDLMRNDLGRVCDFGSVRVETPRQIETHGGPRRGVLQATAAVSGTLRPGLTIADVLATAFPGGSVTGAPKIRAMQIIDELEPIQRGPYCGCFGWIGDDGAAAFNILIRTALLTGTPAGPATAPASTLADGTLDYSIGAGIVADSDPEAEWEETLAKAGILRGLQEPTPAGAG